MLNDEGVYNFNEFSLKFDKKKKEKRTLLWCIVIKCLKVFHPGVREVQISVGRSSAEVLQDPSAGGRELQRGEMRPALLLTGRSRHNAPVDAEASVCSKGRFFVFASIAVQHAVPRAVFKKPVQTQTRFQISDRFRPLLCCVMVQSQSVRRGEGHELVFGEMSETVVFILCGCLENKAQAQQHQQRVSLCANNNHDKMISDIVLFCVLCSSCNFSTVLSGGLLKRLGVCGNSGIGPFRGGCLGFLSAGRQLSHRPAACVS